jgi:antitoxin component of MazEF toxin-antitoxin module
MQVQRQGEDLVVVLPPEVIEQQQLREGDEVVVMKPADRTAFEQALQQVLCDHASTFEYLKDSDGPGFSRTPLPDQGKEAPA